MRAYVPPSARNDVFAFLQGRLDDGNRYVKSHQLGPAIGVTTSCAGAILTTLEEEDWLEIWKDTSRGKVWYITDSVREFEPIDVSDVPEVAQRADIGRIQRDALIIFSRADGSVTGSEIAAELELELAPVTSSIRRLCRRGILEEVPTSSEELNRYRIPDDEDPRLDAGDEEVVV